MIASRLTEGPVALIEIDRPERRNALDAAHADALTDAVRAAPGAGARAVVIAGAGTCFCAGADLDQVTGGGFRERLVAMLDAVATSALPVVAAVEGPAIGAGFQLALACDLRVAGPAARFALPTAKLGFAADPATVDRLASLLGGSRARAVLLACESIDVDTAVASALVHRRGTREEALAWAAEIAGYAPLTLAFYKRLLAAEPAATHDAELAEVWASEDVAEGARARSEGRPPRFTGH